MKWKEKESPQGGSWGGGNGQASNGTAELESRLDNLDVGSYLSMTSEKVLAKADKDNKYL